MMDREELKATARREKRAWALSPIYPLGEKRGKRFRESRDGRFVYYYEEQGAFWIAQNQEKGVAWAIALSDFPEDESKPWSLTEYEFDDTDWEFLDCLCEGSRAECIQVMKKRRAKTVPPSEDVESHLNWDRGIW